MSRLALARWPVWPQKVRTRLALLYAGLFLISGSALLGLTYGLVAANLPAQASAASGTGLTSQQLAKLAIACKQPQPDVGTVELCKRAFSAGEGAAAASVRQRALDSLLLYSLLGLGVMTLASGGLGWFVSGRVLRPVRAITETARRASDQHLGERLALTGARDELKELADTFDEMLERLDRAFVAQRRFVANASHELRTPLTVMRTAIDVALAKPSRTTPQLEDMAARVRRSIDRAENMIEALLVLAISDQGMASSELLDLSAVAEDALDLAAPAITRLGLRVEADLSPAETTGDQQLIERMVWNLVDNAVRHNEPGGWIRVTTGPCGQGVVLRIANSGARVPADAVATLFEPFRRMAGRGDGGVGLGLSIAQSVSAAHRAELDVRSQPEGGLSISIVLPARYLSRTAWCAPSAPAPRPGWSAASETRARRRRCARTLKYGRARASLSVAVRTPAGTACPGTSLAGGARSAAPGPPPGTAGNARRDGGPGRGIPAVPVRDRARPQGTVE